MSVFGAQAGRAMRQLLEAQLPGRGTPRESPHLWSSLLTSVRASAKLLVSRRPWLS